MQTQLSTAQEFNLLDMKENISQLQAALLDAHPEMPMLLRKIHTKLKADPALCTLLTEDEIAQVIAGLKVQTNVELISPAAKAKAAKAPSANSRIKAILGGSIGADDF